MDETRNTPPRNDVITRHIMAAIAITHPYNLAEKIEAILNQDMPSRRATTGSRNGRGAARNGDKVTSIDAANSVNVTQQQRIVLRGLSTATRPLTANGVAAVTGLGLNSASTRMKELVVNGLVEEVATELVGRRHKITYRITARGRERIAA